MTSTLPRRKAYSYLRFSSPEQSKGDSRRRQAQLAEDYAKRQGLELDTQLTFHDLGVSAFRGTNRVTGALGGFLNAVLAGQIPPGSVLLVESFDRLSRQSAWEALPTLQAIINADITLVTLSPEREISRDTLMANPFLLMEILIYMIRSNEESEIKSRRVTTSWANKRAGAKDKPMTAWCPSWLSLDKKAGTFIVHDDRAAVVNRIYAETLMGCSPDSIAFALNREGVPVFGRGKHWHRSFIDRLLVNDTVIGTLTPHSISHVDGKMVRNPKEKVANYYPAVVDDELFHRVQALRAATAGSPMRGKNAKKTVSNVFGGGMAKCGRCGISLVRVNKGGKNAYNQYLACSAAKTGAGCVYETVRYERVEDAFIAAIPDMVAHAPIGDREKELDGEIDRLERNIEGTETALSNLLDSLAARPSVAIRDRITEMETELLSLQATLHDLQLKRADVAGPIVRARLDEMQIAAAEKPLNRTHLNALIRQNFERMVLDYDDRSLELHWKQGGSVRISYGPAK